MNQPGFPDEESTAALVEAVLFASARPLAADTLAAATRSPVEEVEASIPALEERYSGAGTGVVLRRVAGGYQLATNPACSGAVERLRGEARPAPLSGAATEVLAAVLYLGPLSRSEVSASRGVNSDAVVRGLLERGFLHEVHEAQKAGPAENAPGGPATLDVTEQFLVAAGASSREDFPALESLVDQEELDRVREKVSGSPEAGSLETSETSGTPETPEASENPRGREPG